MSRYTTTGELPATLDFGFQGSARRLRARARPTTDAARLLRRRRLLHRHRLQRLRAADLPRQPRHGPRSACSSRTTAPTGADLLDRDRARQLADVPHPRPAGRLLRRRAGLHRRRRRQGRPAGHVRHRRSPTTSTTTVIGTDRTHGSDRYDTDGAAVPADRRSSSALRAANPALADGAQIHRYAADGAGIFAVQPDRRARPGRVPRRGQQRDRPPRPRRFDDLQRRTRRSRPLYGGGDRRCASGRRRPGRRSPCRRCRSRCGRPTGRSPQREGAPAVYLTLAGAPAASSAAAPRSAPRSPSNAVRPGHLRLPAGGHDGLAAARHRRQRAVPRLPGRHRRSPRAPCSSTARWSRTAAGNVSATLVVRHRRRPRRRAAAVAAGRPRHPAGQRQRARARTTPRWAAPATGSRTAPQAQLTLDAQGPDLEGHLHDLPAGAVRLQGGDQQELGRELRRRRRAKDGGNITYTAPGGAGHVLLRPRARTASPSTPQGPIITAPGSFQSELGCAGDWSPACMRPWLQDPDGDGTYTWSTDQIPAGSYEFKVAHGLSLGRELRRRRQQRCDACPVPSDGTVVDDLATSWPPTRSRVKTSRAGSAPGPEQGQGASGWPATSSPGPPTSVPAGTDPALAAVAAALVGRPAAWRWTPRPSPAARRASLTLRRRGAACRGRRRPPRAQGLPRPAAVADAPPGRPAEILRGPGGRGRCTTRSGRLTRRHRRADPRRARRPLRRRAPTRDLGVDLALRPRRRSRLWAPTAQAVDAAALASTASGTAPVSDATRVAMRRDADGVVVGARPRRRGRGARYLYEVRVYAPDHAARSRPTCHRPVLGRADAELHPLGRRRPDRPGAGSPRGWRRSAVAGADAGRRLADLRAARARLLDRRHDASRRRTAAPTSRSPTTATACKHLQGARRGRAQHRAPAADLRHRHDRGGPRPSRQQPACDLRVVRRRTPSSSRPASTAVAGKDGFNWGYDPLPLHGARGLVRRPTRTATGAHRASSARWSAALHRAGLRVVHGRGLQPHAGRRAGPDSRCSTRIVPGYYQRLDADRRGRDLDLLPEHRHRARDDGEAHGRLGRHLGARATRSTASAST